MALSFKVEGLDKLLKQLRDKPREIQEEVDGQIELFCQKVTTKAKQRAPIDLGALRSNTDFRKESEGYSIFSRIEYAPYVEFGTGAYVKVPSGLEGYAIQFKGKGKKQVNLPARPYFFNSFYEEKPDLIVRIKKAINEG